MRNVCRLLVVLLSAVSAWAQSDGPMPFQTPAVSQSKIAFVYGGDIWLVGREGGDATRLTSFAGQEQDPYFSPDGQWIAFSGEYDGNVDVYVVSANGGVPKRVTYHPGADRVFGWTPDGKRILFRSARASSTPRYQRMYAISPAGELPEELPFPMGHSGSMSADGARIAYTPLGPVFNVWRNYRGGTASKIWVARLADSTVEEIPRTNANDHLPMWVGKTVYFVSDRAGIFNIFAYDTDAKKVTQVTKHATDDIAGPEVWRFEASEDSRRGRFRWSTAAL